MTLLTEAMILIVSTIVLAKAAHTVIKSSVKIARITGLGELTVGYLILSVACCLPELTVGITGVASDNFGISISTILGSNISNVCLIIGLVGLLRPVRMAEKTLMRLTEMLFLTSSILIVLLIPVPLGKLVGFVLLSLFFVFSGYSTKKKITLKEDENKIDSSQTHKIKFTSDFYRSLFFLTISVTLIVVSSRFIVSSASKIASILNIAQSILGATIVGLGTSLPELSTALNSLKEKHLKLGLGTSIGSNLTRLTLVLGIILLVSPHSINFNTFATLIVFVLISTITLLIFLGRFGRKKLERKEGIILLTIYALFILMIFMHLFPGLGLFSFILKK